jgi:hypothetical protein
MPVPGGVSRPVLFGRKMPGQQRRAENWPPSGSPTTRKRFSMARFEQFEIWEFKKGRWQLAASFSDFEVAQVMALHRGCRVRVMQVIYEEGKPPQQQVLTDIGATRDEP